MKEERGIGLHDVRTVSGSGGVKGPELSWREDVRVDGDELVCAGASGYEVGVLVVRNNGEWMGGV